MYPVPPGSPTAAQYVTAPGSPTGAVYGAPQGSPPGMVYVQAPAGYPPGTMAPGSPTGMVYAAPPSNVPGATYAVAPGSPTVVVYTAPPPQSPAPPRGWSTGICGCTSNCCNCCMVTWLPCVTYGQIAARVGTNGCCENCSCCVYASLYTALLWFGGSCLATCLLRQAVAQKVGVTVNGCDDCCCSCMCGPCVLCQVANHLELQKDGCTYSAPPKLENMQR